MPVGKAAGSYLRPARRLHFVRLAPSVGRTSIWEPGRSPEGGTGPMPEAWAAIAVRSTLGIYPG